MSRLSELAYAHNRQRIRLGNQLGRRVQGLWAKVPLEDMSGGFRAISTELVVQITSAQLTAADQAAPFLAAADSVWGFDSASVDLNVSAFANVMGDGSPIAPATYAAVTKTKTLIGAGMPARQAFQTGGAFLALLAKNALHDMGRAADMSLAAGKGYTRYVRVVNAGACSRCAILAGASSGARAYKRHPSCQCSSMPLPPLAKTPKGIASSPTDYFQSLSRAEQDRVFGKAGAEAIRHGADPIAVVNASRGAYTATLGVRADGSPLTVAATSEGTTARGRFYKTIGQSLRLMPEQLQVMAGGDHDRWVELLFRYGYLDPSGQLIRKFR